MIIWDELCPIDLEEIERKALIARLMRRCTPLGKKVMHVPRPTGTFYELWRKANDAGADGSTGGT